MKRLILLLCLAVVTLFAPLSLLAAGYGLVNETVDNVGAPLPSFALIGSNITCDVSGGACGFIILALDIVARLRPILTIVAVLLITILGVRMIIGQEDDRLEKTRATMTGMISGLVLVYLIEPFVQAFYGSSGEVFRGEMAAGSTIVNTEVGGLIRWVLVIVASLSVLMIILTAFKAIAKGSEEGIAEIRKAILSLAAGIVLLVLNSTIVSAFIESPESPVPVLGILAQLVGVVLGFLSLVFLAIVIYAALILLFSLGNPETAGKAKGLLTRASIGVVVILVSLLLVNLIIVPLTN